MNLTYKMRNDLKRLANAGPDDSIRTRSITNSTLQALKSRGLATVTVNRDPQFGCLVEFWDVTDAGRKAVR